MGASSAQVACVVRFGVFELDVRSGELRRAGVRVNLQDQPLKVLECLLERPGELVTREELRQRLWPGDTFVDFEQGVNAAVKRLRETLADSAETPRFVETLHRRGYRFIAPVDRADPARPGPAPTGRVMATAGRTTWPALTSLRRSRSVRHDGVHVLIAAGAIAARARDDGCLAARASAATPAPPLQCGFAHDADRVGGRADVLTGREPGCVCVGRRTPGQLGHLRQARRVLRGAAPHHPCCPRLAPRWSPDGTWIAYPRVGIADNAPDPVDVVARRIGPRVQQFRARPPASWSPDGRYLVAARVSEAGAPDQSNGIYLIPVETGEPRPITRAVAPANDNWPAFSPDGRHVAYAACEELVYQSNCHIEVVDLDQHPRSDSVHRAGSRRSPVDGPGRSHGPRWKSVIYAARQGALVQHVASRRPRRHPPARVEVAGIDAAFPATRGLGDRLAFSKLSKMRISTAGTSEGSPGRWLDRRRRTRTLSFRRTGPNGLLFGRSGDAFEVWVADADGSRPERLTRGPGGWQCSPTWSPDGKRIAFDSQAEDGSWHIWTMDVQGGTPHQITKEAGDQVRPTWSRDGQWIYFLLAPRADQDVWRTRGPNQPNQRVTHGGSVHAHGSRSIGNGVFYKRNQADSPLYFQPLSGGASRQIIACVTGSRFSIVLPRDLLCAVPASSQS